MFRQRSSSLPPGEAAAQIKRIEEENGTKKSKIAEEVNISLHIGDHGQDDGTHDESDADDDMLPTAVESLYSSSSRVMCKIQLGFYF